jgi:hypothetical protein
MSGFGDEVPSGPADRLKELGESIAESTVERVGRGISRIQ